jgi:hypothetical protein
MTEDFRQQRISDLAAALVAASRLVKTNKPQAAVLDAEDDVVVKGDRNPNYGKLDRSFVNNVLIAQLMQRHQAAEAKQL